jgi:hypothetical protein
MFPSEHSSADFHRSLATHAQNSTPYQTVDEGRRSQSQSPFQSQDTRREDLEGDEADGWSAPAARRDTWYRVGRAPLKLALQRISAVARRILSTARHRPEVVKGPKREFAPETLSGNGARAAGDRSNCVGETADIRASPLRI